MTYKSNFQIKVNYWTDLFDDGQIFNDDFLINPIALDDDLKNKIYHTIDEFVKDHISKKQS